jgi:hypothetical protein
MITRKKNLGILLLQVCCFSAEETKRQALGHKALLQASGLLLPAIQVSEREKNALLIPKNSSSSSFFSRNSRALVAKLCSDDGCEDLLQNPRFCMYKIVSRKRLFVCLLFRTAVIVFHNHSP